MEVDKGNSLEQSVRHTKFVERLAFIEVQVIFPLEEARKQSRWM